MKSYRTAFLAALVGNAALAAALGLLWWRGHAMSMKAPAEPKPAVIAAEAGGAGPSPAEAPAAGESPAPAAPAESPLAPLQLTPQRLQGIGVKTGVVELKSVRDEIRTVGNVEVDETRLSYVQLRFPGWIRTVFADSTYQYLRKGQRLFTIYSPELVTTEREYLLAKQNRNLLVQSSVPGVASGAASLLNAAAERLKQWEIPAREIQHLDATGEVMQELEIDSPVSGYITERNALPNMYVQPESRLYTVADLSQVWVYAQVFQTDIGRLRIGDPAAITVDTYPGRAFSGRVNFIWPRVEEATRTVRVRLVFPNPDLKLLPGMFVNLRLDIPLGRRLVIPASGVFQSGERQTAFIDRGDGQLEPREIELGPRVGDEFVVLKGLEAGERIVTSANFLIDSESQLQAAMGSFAPPPPGAGAAASMNAPAGAAAATIEFTTSPSPPRKGANTFRVRLTGGNGAPIPGAQVTVTFFMAAMPSMGMAAMRTASTLTDRGGGMYEGSGTLGSGGTWQVTIAASRNGQAIARKQLTVVAEGGM